MCLVGIPPSIGFYFFSQDSCGTYRGWDRIRAELMKGGILSKARHYFRASADTFPYKKIGTKTEIRRKKKVGEKNKKKKKSMAMNYVFSWFDSSLPPLLLFFSFLFLIIKRSFSKNIKLPPSPPKLPLIGNLHQLLSSSVPHHTLHSLSKKYGPLMLLQLGQIPTLVVSSPYFAQEIMRTHDAIFASRPSVKAARIMLYGCTDLTFAPYGEYWKQLRKLCVNHLLGSKLVQSFRRVREEEVASMINEIVTTCSSLSSIDMSKVLNLFTNSILCRAVLGKSYRGEEKKKIFCELTKEVSMLFGKLYVEDCFPSLGWLDMLTGFERRAIKCSKRWGTVLDEVIDDHVRKLKDQHYKPEDKNFVDVLLDLQNDTSAEFAVNREMIKILIHDMIGAGTDTSFIALEWGMAELIRNPKVMKKLQDETRGIANKEDSMIKEEDLSKMTYLKAVIKEILRLHPPAALLVPRESMEMCTIQGYEIPKKTRVIINAWAIGRDPGFWDAPEEFRPERFLNSSVDFTGHDFEFIPFGAGRRICPGMQFAISTLKLALANLVLRFDWKLPEQIELKNIDMTEVPGLTNHKKEKLNLVAKPAFIM